jgi:hypothetical protein
VLHQVTFYLVPISSVNLTIKFEKELFNLHPHKIPEQLLMPQYDTNIHIHRDLIYELQIDLFVK